MPVPTATTLASAKIFASNKCSLKESAAGFSEPRSRISLKLLFSLTDTP